MKSKVDNIDNNPTAAVDIRVRLAERLPGFLQPLASRFTGKALPDQTLPNISPLRHLTWAAVWFVLGIACSAAGVGFRSWVLLAPGWLMTVHGARKLQLTIVHYCAHSTVFDTKTHNIWLGRLVSLILLITEFDSYKFGHIKHHMVNLLSTLEDPTKRFLIEAGIRPGLSKRVLWGRLVVAMFSPQFHLRVFAERIVSHFRKTSLFKRVAAALYLISLIAVTAWSGAWLTLLLAFLIPVVFLYQIAQLLRLCVEHRWPTVQNERRSREEVKELTNAVFIGALPPASNLRPMVSLFAWVSWGVLMTGHALARTCVMVGDTPCHDVHHDYPTSRGWSNYAVTRQRNLKRAEERGRRDYTEVWGLLRAIDSNFESFSNASSFGGSETGSKLNIVVPAKEVNSER